MATKVSGLTEITTASDSDLLHIIHNGASRNIQKINLVPDPLPISLVDRIVHIRDEKPSGTNGGTFSAGAWRTRDLNVIAYDAGGHASLSANQITLAAGTYLIDAYATCYHVRKHQLKLKNISNDTDLLLGGTGNASGDTGLDANQANIMGVFILGTESIIELQHSSTSSQSNTGFGPAASFGTEVYTDIIFTKLD